MTHEGNIDGALKCRSVLVPPGTDSVGVSIDGADAGEFTLVELKVPDPRSDGRQITRYERVFRSLGREIRRLATPQPPAWLEGADFAFPGWEPRSRPFDWAHDLEGAPVAMPWPERARSWAYLRAPAAVVKR